MGSIGGCCVHSGKGDATHARIGCGDICTLHGFVHADACIYSAGYKRTNDLHPWIYLSFPIGQRGLPIFSRPRDAFENDRGTLWSWVFGPLVGIINEIIIQFV